MKRLMPLCALVALVGYSATAQITNPVALSESTHFVKDLTVPGYDSSLGPLRAVSFCYRYRHFRSIAGESGDAAPSIVDVGFEPGFLQIRSGTDVLDTIPFPPASQVFAVSEFDGGMDFEGTSSFEWRTMEHGNGILHITDPAMMARFVDVRQATITLQGFDLFSASGSGNLNAQSVSNLQLQAEVIYSN